jgi:dipeptidyl-peptidase-3
MKHAHTIRFTLTLIHELLGHGSGKILAETAPGEFNFNHVNPPISPVTEKAIQRWYKRKETWGTVFGNLAPSVEECRAFLFSYYFIDNKDILPIFGYTENSLPTADDREYSHYQLKKNSED